MKSKIQLNSLFFALLAFTYSSVPVLAQTAPTLGQSNLASPVISTGLTKKLDVTTGKSPKDVSEVKSLYSGLIFNQSNPWLKDRRVRQALSLVFNMNWINKVLMEDQLMFTQSLFAEASYSAVPGEISSAERAIFSEIAERGISLESLSGELPAWSLAMDDSYNRINRRKAMKLFKQAGFYIQPESLLMEKEGVPFKLMAYVSGRTQEKILVGYAYDLRKMGIQLEVLKIQNPTAAETLKTQNNYDLIFGTIGDDRFRPEVAKLMASLHSQHMTENTNLGRVNNWAVDHLLDRMSVSHASNDSKSFVALAKVLDRIVQKEYYLIPVTH